MFIKRASTAAISTALIVSAVSVAASQTTAPTDSSTPMAEECLLEMNEFAQQMYQNEFWLSGWGEGSYGAPPAPQSTAAPAMTPPPSGTTTTTAPEAGITGQAAGSPMDPRGQSVGIDTPRYQIRALYSAARVLAHRGDSEACDYVVTKMNEVYDGYSQQLQDAGVDPASVTTWRQEQLALAQPLAGSEGMSYRIDNITGTDVRNLQDENLGSVNDVIFDPSSGEVVYVIVARGGFLGMGDDYYAIPWDQVSATPGLDTVVIDRAEVDLEQAPAVDPDRFRNPETMMDERRITDEFWTQRG